MTDSERKAFLEWWNNVSGAGSRAVMIQQLSAGDREHRLLAAEMLRMWADELTGAKKK